MLGSTLKSVRKSKTRENQTMPSFNHTREDGFYAPCDQCWEEMSVEARRESVLGMSPNFYEDCEVLALLQSNKTAFNRYLNALRAEYRGNKIPMEVPDVRTRFTLEGAESFSTFINTSGYTVDQVGEYVRKKAAQFGIGVKKIFDVERSDDKDHPGRWQTLTFWFEEPLDDTDEAEVRGIEFVEFLSP